MKSLFLPKYEQKLSRLLPSLHRGDILTIFRSYFGRNYDFKKFILKFTDLYEVNVVNFGLRYQKPEKSDSKIRFSIFLDINTKFQTKFMSIKQHSHMELCVKNIYLFNKTTFQQFYVKIYTNSLVNATFGSRKMSC